MEKHEKDKITKISKGFAIGIIDDSKNISGTGWLVVDPLSAYLNFLGYKNTLTQIPKINGSQVLIINFEDGTQFIPSGSDIKENGFKDWMWV